MVKMWGVNKCWHLSLIPAARTGSFATLSFFKLTEITNKLERWGERSNWGPILWGRGQNCDCHRLLSKRWEVSNSSIPAFWKSHLLKCGTRLCVAKNWTWSQKEPWSGKHKEGNSIQAPDKPMENINQTSVFSRSWFPHTAGVLNIPVFIPAYPKLPEKTGTMAVLPF